MALTAFFLPIFIEGVTEINQIDTGVGTGSQDTYPLANKTYTQMGAVSQVGTQLIFLYTGGYTKNPDDTVTFLEPPSDGVQLVLPGLGCSQTITYCVTGVEGESDPLVGTTSFFFGDISSIHANKYVKPAGKPGIEIFFVNNITSGGLPDLTWVSLSSGNMSTWTSTGSSLYTDQLTGFSTVAASADSGLNSILVNSATSSDYFIAQDYVIFNPGNDTQEILRIQSISYNLLTFSSSFNYPHYVDEPVFSCLRQIDIRQTTPFNFTDNTAKNYYNISYKINANQVQRS